MNNRLNWVYCVCNRDVWSMLMGTGLQMWRVTLLPDIAFVIISLEFYTKLILDWFIYAVYCIKLFNCQTTVWSTKRSVKMYHNLVSQQSGSPNKSSLTSISDSYYAVWVHIYHSLRTNRNMNVKSTFCIPFKVFYPTIFLPIERSVKNQQAINIKRATSISVNNNLFSSAYHIWNIFQAEIDWIPYVFLRVIDFIYW